MTRASSSKIVVWDADGVIFKIFDDEGQFIWSASIDKDLGVSKDTVEHIFSAQWKDVISGARDTRQHIKEVFEQYGVGIPVDVFLPYWLAKCDTINGDVAALLGRYISYIATNQDPLRAAHFQKIFSKTIRKVYASSAIGFLKPDKEFYEYIEKDLSIPTSNIWFVDDTLENVIAAKKRGWKAHQFIDVPSLVSFLEAE